MPNASIFFYLFMCFRASCSTQMFHNSCVRELLAQHKYKYSCAPELLVQHKHQIPMCFRAPHSTQNISSMMCFKDHAQHMKSYIKHMQLAYAQYNKQIIMFMCSGVLDPIYQLKHQSNIIRNGAYAHKC